MWQKKWINLCLLIGCVLLVATAVSFPLYQTTAYDRMLQDEFSAYMSEKGNWPMVIRMSANCKKDVKDTIARMEEYNAGICDELGTDEYLSTYYYYLLRSPVTSTIAREDASDMTLSLASMSDLSDHAKLVFGRMYSDDGIDEDGSIEVIVPQYTMTNKGLLLDEKLVFDRLKDPDGNPISIKVVGVYTGRKSDDFYFQDDPERLFDTVFMNPELFKRMCTGENSKYYNITVVFYSMPDFRSITGAMVSDVIDKTEYICEKSSFNKVIKTPDYMDLLRTYELKVNRISATLTILQIPVFVLLAAFLVMISSQMYEMERNEISVIKSRGSRGSQIFLLYLYQGCILTGFGACLGIPLGALFAGLLGSVRNFLEIDLTDYMPVTFSLRSVIYTVIAMIVTLMCISLPAVFHSRVTIVNLKQQKAVNKKKLWEKLYLDIVLIGVSLYGYYSFKKDLSLISTDVLSGRKLDPLLYVSSSLFIVGCGLLFLRLLPLIIRIIYLCFRKICGPSEYISFMENIKNGRKMQLIMLFLIMTISLGMYHATVARTILENALLNARYLGGADIIIKETWDVMRDENGDPTGVYIEPDISKYMGIESAKSFTKVYYDDKAYLKKARNARTVVTLMAIHTKEFGSMTELESGLNEKTYHEYLNELALVKDGVILSSNFKAADGVEVGDKITYYTGDGKSISGTVVDFIDYFPSYSPRVTVINEEGEAETEDNYLIVTNYAWVKKYAGLKPYEIWIQLKDNTVEFSINDFIEKHNMVITKYVNKASDMEKTMTDPLLQGTNGVLTLGFIVTMSLCVVGYLLYWIMSIRERELIFGVLRACGFHKSEMTRMLVYEQIFSGVFSSLSGIGIGKLTSEMFVPLLQASYATSEQILPMRLITRASDMYRMYGIIAGVMIVCIITLVIMLFRMNVTGALKLGEE